MENLKTGCLGFPNIPETELYQAILEAVRSLPKGHQKENVSCPGKQIGRPSSPEILSLKKRRQQAEKAAQLNQPQQSKRVELQRLLREQELNLTQYEDTLTFRLVGRVTILS